MFKRRNRPEDYHVVSTHTYPILSSYLPIFPDTSHLQMENDISFPVIQSL